MRDHILDIAEEMVQTSGYGAISYQKIAREVGLSKTAIFHHFPSKDELARSLMDRCQSKYGAMYDDIIESDRSAPEKINVIVDAFETGLRENQMCLMGALSQSMLSLSEPLQDELEQVVEEIVSRYARVFEQGQQEGSLYVMGSPQDAGAAFLAALQGLQILARAKKDMSFFRQGADSYVKSLVVE